MPRFAVIPFRLLKSGGRSLVIGARKSPKASTLQRKPSLLDQPVILIVRPDPKPLHLLAAQESQCAVVTAHSCRPEISYSLEMKRGMARVLLPEFKILSCQPTNFRRQLQETPTKTWGRRGLHRAALSADRLPLPSGAYKAPPISRFPRLPRFADPTPQHPARSSDATNRETPMAGVLQWLLRSRPACSHGKGNFKGATLASAAPLKRNGAALVGARNRGFRRFFVLPFLSFNGATEGGIFIDRVVPKGIDTTDKWHILAFIRTRPR